MFFNAIVSIQQFKYSVSTNFQCLMELTSINSHLLKSDKRDMGKTVCSAYLICTQSQLINGVHVQAFDMI